MKNETITNSFYSMWKQGIHTDHTLTEELKQHGLDSLQIIETLNFFKKKRLDERQTIGFVLAGIGSFLGFLSCVFTMLDVFPEFRGFVLYGLTSLGIVVATLGLYFIFE